ncbi:ACT domain-containing protein [Antribacter sp. KLBMP9083]|uniref:ACT domain-containing protein n=1 Tax=Antribacter soli TaxID=2910976 RepID=A0AA41QGC6_9MICO|nr:ACT domain-containing protein [Antribacter soli]MCF4122621.1 ACT domain-containing protein [Antribacter soli]
MSELSLQVLPDRFVLEHQAGSVFPEDDEWVALVRAPEGLTVLRHASPFAPDGERWAGLYGDPHRARVAGVLASVVGPLAETGIELLVASTFHADLVLVPEDRLEAAVDVLREAGHPVDAKAIGGARR